ncbi:MAG: glycosyltransferase [Gemmatimonadales bacterium]
MIIPITERPEELGDLHREYAEALSVLDQPVEFVYATEPWRREHTRQVAKLAEEGDVVRIVEAAQTVGEASLLKLAAERSRGDILITSPAYFRVEAGSLINMIERIEAGADMVIARRWPRSDSWINRMQTRAFHFFLGKIGGGRISDVACGVRAMRRGVLEGLPLYGDFHRFLPVLAMREGYRVEEISCHSTRETLVRGSTARASISDG